MISKRISSAVKLRLIDDAIDDSILAAPDADVCEELKSLGIDPDKVFDETPSVQKVK